MTKWKLVIAAVLVALGASFAIACSSSDNNSSATDTPAMSDETPGATEMAEATETPDNGDVSGGGTATLTVGDQTYTFSGYYCAVGADETQNSRVSFSSGAFGESMTGARTQLDVSIQDTNESDATSGEGTIHSITLNDVDDFENPSVDWEAVTGIVGAPDFEIQIDGKNISASANFDDGTTDAVESVPGTFEGTCP